MSPETRIEVGFFVVALVVCALFLWTSYGDYQQRVAACVAAGNAEASCRVWVE